MIFRRFPLGCAIGLLGFLTLSARVAVQAQDSNVYQIKAAFLYNFTKFVEWPSDKFANSSSPIVIGVLGKNSFAKELEAIVKDRKVNGRELVVRGVESAGETKGLHVLFVSAGEERRLAGIVGPFPASGLLTVGESGEFARLGGIINFILEMDKVRFEIDIDAAEKSGIKISAQLQKLAKAVRKKS